MTVAASAMKSRTKTVAQAGIAATAAIHSTAGATAMRGELLLYSLTGVGATVWADLANAPPEVIWIVASAAGTVCGATASAFAYANLSGAQRFVRVLVSFLVGLLLAPYAAAHIPRPDNVPQALHIFSMSGACAFGAWSLVRVVQRRMTAIADSILDRVAPRNRGKDDSEGNVP